MKTRKKKKAKEPTTLQWKMIESHFECLANQFKGGVVITYESHNTRNVYFKATYLNDQGGVIGSQSILESWKDVKEGKFIECADCPNEFKAEDIRPYKYEPEILVCDSCHDERMED